MCLGGETGLLLPSYAFHSRSGVSLRCLGVPSFLSGASWLVLDCSATELREDFVCLRVCGMVRRSSHSIHYFTATAEWSFAALSHETGCFDAKSRNMFACLRV